MAPGTTTNRSGPTTTAEIVGLGRKCLPASRRRPPPPPPAAVPLPRASRGGGTKSARVEAVHPHFGFDTVVAKAHCDNGSMTLLFPIVEHASSSHADHRQADIEAFLVEAPAGGTAPAELVRDGRQGAMEKPW